MAEHVPPTPDDVIGAVREHWDGWTSDTENWTPDNPAEGYDALSACVVQRIMGGVILRAEAASDERRRAHYYNLVPADGVPTVVDVMRDFMPDDAWLRKADSHQEQPYATNMILAAMPGRDIRFNYLLAHVQNELGLPNDSTR